MGFREVLARGAFAFIKIRHSIQAHAIYPEVEPEVQYPLDFGVHKRIVKIEVGLMRVKAMPIICLGHRVPSPIRGLKISKNNAGFPVFLYLITPDIKVAPRAALWRPT